MAELDITNASIVEILNAVLVKDTATGRYGLRTQALATSLSSDAVDLNVDMMQVARGLLGSDADGTTAVKYKRIVSTANTQVGNQNLSIEEIIRKCLAYDENGQLCITIIENV